MIKPSVFFIFLSLVFSSCASKNLKNEKIKDIGQERSDEITNLLISEGEITPVNQYSSTGVIRNINPVSSTKKEQFDKNLTDTLKLEGGDEELIKNWIEYFSVKDRERFQRMLNRGEVYREIVQNILIDNGLPSELFYLALIESGFVTSANSQASAKGVWQFMKGTGEQYGLFISSMIDEREDPIRATEAAAKYLRKLYSAYESWELAFAAYNAGEYRILTSIMKGETRNYWELADKKLIPPETRNYVPKIIAAMRIARDLDKYGFELNPEKESLIFPDLKAYEVVSPVRIKSIAYALDISVEDVLKYNPHLKNGVTPMNQSTYEIWLPDVNSYENQRLLRELKAEKHQTMKIVEATPRNIYKVKRGDTLSGISRKLNTSIYQLKKFNNLNENKIFVGQQLRYMAQNYRSVSSTNDEYSVRAGDTLSKISKRFNIRISNLKKYNNLTSNHLYSGQKLKLTANYNENPSVHIVKSGENLTLIAKKYGKEIEEIKEKNKLQNSQIFPGQELRI